MVNFELKNILQKCLKAKFIISTLSSQKKNTILQKMSEEILKNKSIILKANEKDLEKAKEKKLSSSLLDRLSLNENRIVQMAKALVDISLLPDPVGEVVWGTTRPNGLRIRQIRVPLGIILVIYEARPNVTTDAAGLCFKSGNVCILRGGSDSFYSNQAIVQVLKNVLNDFNLPEDIITFTSAPPRAWSV